jgi:hypothetical protein
MKMPLKNAIKSDPGFDKAKITQKFERLPPKQKAAVLSYIKGQEKPDFELDEIGKGFTDEPIFKDMFSDHKKTPPKRHMPGMDKMTLMSGLMQVVRKFVGDPDEDKQGLNPEYAERMGGSQRMGSPFDGKFESAFRTEGVRGLARLHKSMLNDVDYQQFLDEV